MASACPGISIPLVYPEAMLFPSLFWKDDGVGESILGSMPAALLMHSHFLSQYGFASLVLHWRSRLTNYAFGASSDFQYICYAFDALANLGCRGQDTRVILSRGLDFSNSGFGIKAKGDSEPIFDTDNVDSRLVLNKLAAGGAKKQVTYFCTHTCNQANHFSIR